MAAHRLKPDDIASPIDIRLIPAALLTAGVCLIMPLLSLAAVRWAPYVLALIGIIVLVVVIVRNHPGRLRDAVVLTCIACWLALPAAFLAQHQQVAAHQSGWKSFVADLGTAKMSVQVVSDPVERDGPFGPNWYLTADVEHFGTTLTATAHPAKIVISGGEAWSQVTTGDTVCFLGRVTEAESTIFVQSVTDAKLGGCEGGTSRVAPSGRDVIRAAVREQTSETLSYAPQLLPGLILGDRSQQTEAIDESMKVSGLSHLSAVSGAHTSLIAGAATVLFRSLRLPRPVVVGAFMGTLLLFVQIVGMQPSIIRAATMGAIAAWAVFFGRGSQALPMLALSTIVILSLSPEIIHDVGFQLSVAATAGIILGAQPLERWCFPLFAKFLPDFWARMTSSSLAISVAAQVACQPLLLTFVDYVSLYSVIANLFATPLLPLITIPGTLGAAISVALPGVSRLIFDAVGVPAAVIGWIATTAAGLPGAKLPWPDGIAGVLLIALHWSACGIILVKLLRWQRRARPPVKLQRSISRWQLVGEKIHDGWTVRQTVQYLVVIAAIVGHLAVFWPTTSARIHDQWDLIGCDVGQGDMFLVRTGPVSAIVIDTGSDPELARTCLRQASVSQVDALFITHLHADHVGGVDGVFEVADPTEIFYSTGTDETFSPERAGIPSVAQKVLAPHVGIIDHARHRDDHAVQLRWSVLAANHQTQNENNASLILFLEIFRHGGRVTALFTGDVEEDEMTHLLAQNAIPSDIDVLKLSHHGARNGGTEIIAHTSPQVALVGVGADNTYGHPHDDILDALGPQAHVQRTDLDGTFSVTFQANEAYVAAER